MSQMPQLAACPSCEWPLESGDRFCGACGYDLSVVPAPPEDTPTITMNGAAAPPPAEGAPVSWPVAPGTDGSDTPAPVHLPSDIRGTDSGGSELHVQGEPMGEPPGEAGPQQPHVPGPHVPGPQPHVPGARPPGPGAQPPGPGAQPPGPGAQPPLPGPQPHVPGPQPDGSPPHGSEPHGSEPHGSEPHAQAAPSGQEQPAARGVRFDRRAGLSADAGDYHLAAPQPVDPRTADLATPPAGTKTCVACRSGHVDRDGYCENCGHAQPRERDHMEQELGSVAAVSDRGLRHHRNEDAFAVSSTALPDGTPAVVAVVCDGVSSATRPDDASMAAAHAANESLLEALPRGTHPQPAMHDAIVAASNAVNSLAEEPETAQEHAPHQNAPACTLVAAIVTSSLLVVGWVGDSRAYWVPADRSSPPARLTEDDSWAAQMVAAGLMNEAEAYADRRAHAITGWLGADAYELEPHTASFKPDRPGVVVVCTDGLWNYAEAAEEMAEVVPPDAAQRPLHAARVLVGHALDGGGHDNVTVAVLPFPAPPQGAGSA
ncbi:serine/threonine-protein phosphatase [Streptomyces phyllanthi]|uniref:Serine/threonine-protein phosphatase n=1 Tax=Streptomyces phyllanthi TaxID=1803180 RepID=A0A5N8W5W6_9ACTN|nr:protein phosphatase 2C domain-containing protein [Streptomyces phyllanthi]MPY41738.1 serine/threonine-protein phosphatase [Streptomyces phyllanthi]